MSSGPMQQPQQPSGEVNQTIPSECLDEKALVEALKRAKPIILKQVEAVLDYETTKAEQALDACITANGGGKIAP